MFFSQFLSLFYLMTLTSTYTISKIKINEENSNSVIDYVNDKDNPQRTLKFVKTRKHRREEPELGIKFISTKPKTFKHYNTIKRRSGFWRKYKNKYKTTIPMNDYDSINNIQDYYNFDDVRKKRSEHLSKEVISDKEENTVASIYKRAVNNKETDLRPYQKYINDVVRNLTEQKSSTPDYKENLNNVIAKLSSRVHDSNLVRNEQEKSTPKGLKVQMIDTTQVNIEEGGMATAQIEALLNEIKERAVQMVSETNPSLSDLISNTVTETTFEADPLLNKIALTTPGFAFSTFVTVNEVFYKRTINDTNLTINENQTNTLSPHKIDSRSLKEDGMTIAQTIEDYLQKELKSLYKKVKGRVGKDFQKEVKHAKSTIKKESSKITKKITSLSSTKAMHKDTKTTKKTKPVVRSNRGDATKKLVTTRPTSTVDDYILLTLYEQILAKTHEDNVMKMVTMPAIHFIKKRNDYLISKRNSETLADLKLKDDLKKIYDDGIMAPDTYDFSTDINVDISTPSNDYSEEIKDQDTTERIATDTSYEGLTNKLSYNDYVNGYKYYLKYQKDEANTNFSNLVRYQAHRHHNVDDIGKFILNKIPQITTLKRDKRSKNKIFDDNDFDDQEVSTKTDDSWFKKHFYMFVDNGPPKKFHTSQTVAFKVSTGNVTTKKDRPITKNEVEERAMELSANEDDKNEESHDVNLEELSKDLEGMLSSMDKVERKATTAMKTGSILNAKNSAFQNLPMVKELQLNIEKFFGKGRRTISSTEKGDKKVDNYDDALHDTDDEDIADFDVSMINNFHNVNENNFDISRVKRNLKKQVKSDNNLKNIKKSTLNLFSRSESANKTKKYGCVNVDLVPTQIVTLRNKKESRLKKLLNVFHRNKNKVHKRDNQRLQRFSFKKLKDMFLSKPDDKSNDKALSALDYELLTTRLTGFKPYKFDRVQSLEDMRKQIPNITDDLKEKAKINEIINDYDLKKDVSDVTEITKDSLMSYTDYNFNDSFLDNVESQLQASVKSTKSTVNYAEFSTPTPSTTFSTYSTKMKSTSFPLINYKYRDNTINDNVFTINILDNLTIPETKTTSIPRITAEDVKKELDKLQVKVTLNSNYYDRPYLNKLSVNAPITVKEKAKNALKRKEANEGIIIGTKETRIAKFHFKPKQKNENIDVVPVLESPQFYEGVYETHTIPKGFFDDNTTVNTDKEVNVNHLTNNMDLSNINNNMKKSILDTGIQNFVTVLPTGLTSITPGFNDGKTLKPFPDYFNDLLMWNNDILNYDRVPQWHRLIHSDFITEYSTPDVQDIKKELNDLEEVISSYYATEKRDESSNIVTKRYEVPSINDNIPKATKNSLIRRVAVNDNAIGSSKEIFIKGEAKYFRWDKQPVELAEEYIKTIDVVNRINNFNSKDGFHKNIPRKDDRFNRIDSKSANGIPLAVDSTLFSYDDDVDFVTATLAPKKLSKNSLKPFESLRNRTTMKPKSKINVAPKQYFATPLPMKMNNFEKFLKENNLDVASVTSPLMELPSITKDPLTKQHVANNKMKEAFQKEDGTVLNKKFKAFDGKKKLHTMTESKLGKTKPKITRDILEADLEDLDRLHRELFKDSESSKVKRDTNIHDHNIHGPEKYIDNVKLFEEVENDQSEPKLDANISNNAVTTRDMVILKIGDKNDGNSLINTTTEKTLKKID